jgi:hypothetical protein
MMRYDYGTPKPLPDSYSDLKCPSCGQNSRYREAALKEAENLICPGCNTKVGCSYIKANIKTAELTPYPHDPKDKGVKLPSSTPSKKSPSERKDDPEEPKVTPMYKSLTDVHQKVIPQVLDYIKKIKDPKHEDFDLPGPFRIQLGHAAKAYSDAFSMLVQVKSLIDSNIKLANVDNDYIEMLETISKTGAKQYFKEKLVGVDKWSEDIMRRIKLLNEAVARLSFKGA